MAKTKDKDKDSRSRTGKNNGGERDAAGKTKSRGAGLANGIAG